MLFLNNISRGTDSPFMVEFLEDNEPDDLTGKTVIITAKDQPWDKVEDDSSAVFKKVVTEFESANKVAVLLDHDDTYINPGQYWLDVVVKDGALVDRYVYATFNINGGPTNVPPRGGLEPTGDSQPMSGIGYNWIRVNKQTNANTITVNVVKATIGNGGGGSEGIPEAPNDGKQYGRQSKKWTEITGGGGGESDYLWRPTVDSSGNISWVKSSSTTTPVPQNIKGPPGQDSTVPGPQGPKGEKGDPGSAGDVETATLDVTDPATESPSGAASTQADVNVETTDQITALWEAENVLDNKIGDIGEALDLINGEVI